MGGEGVWREEQDVWGAGEEGREGVGVCPCCRRSCFAGSFCRTSFLQTLHAFMFTATSCATGQRKHRAFLYGLPRSSLTSSIIFSSSPSAALTHTRPFIPTATSKGNLAPSFGKIGFRGERSLHLLVSKRRREQGG